MTLSEVATIERAMVDPSTLDPDTPYLGLEHIERGGRIIGCSTIAASELASTKFRFTSEHVLFGKLRPNLGKVSRPTFAGVCSTDILPLRPGASLDRDFLAHFLAQPTMVDYAASRTSGANLPRLSPGVLASFELPLPALDEQRRIAAVLDAADAIRTKRRAILARLDALTQTVFHQMFGAISGTTLLGDVVEEFRYGTSNKSGVLGYPALRIPNVIGGSIDTGEIKTVDVNAAELRRLMLRDGDLLFVRTNGNPDNVGRSAIFSTSAIESAGFGNQPWIYASYLIRARLSNAVLPTFVTAYLATAEGRKQLRERSKTSAGQYNINTKSLTTILVPDVPLADQEVFAARAVAIEFQRARVQRALAADDELFAALQYRAFQGGLDA